MYRSSGHSGRFGHEFLGKSEQESHRSRSSDKDQNLILELSAMDALHLRDTQTTPTTAMILSSGKRVSYRPDLHIPCVVHVTDSTPVCVSSLMIDEIKRIIKDSEILK